MIESVWSINKDHNTHYVQNDSDRISRCNNWRSDIERNGHNHSESRPGYRRNGRSPSGQRYMKDRNNSRFRSQSNGARSQSR